MIQSSKLSMTEPAQTEFKESGSRLKKRKHFHDEAHNSGYEFTSFEERFKVEVFNPSFDLLSTQLRELHEKSSKVSRLFAPFFSGWRNYENRKKKAAELEEAYPNDLNEEELSEEILLLLKIRRNMHWDTHSALELLNLIFDHGYEKILPQTCVALRFLLVLTPSVASGERAFSKLLLIKNRLRSTME